MKVPESIINAVGFYYLNRYRQYDVQQHHGKPGMPELTVARSSFDWKKELDICRIEKACRSKWKMVNAAGTFFFTNMRTKEVYQVDEETFPSVKRVK